mgnify:CR=1 FL=1|jgi:hypothetical protein|tara:strand:+ start:1595 stop:1963 length:369 start_codon:yes stop_codon:yes gene_type:complete
MKYAQAEEYSGGAWKLPKNDIWNIPERTKDPDDNVRFEIETMGPWQIIVRLKALAIDLDGKVYGMRTMYAPKESGYHREGRISIGGKKRWAFTSSRLFEREDGSLCDVACFIVIGGQSNGQM